MTHFLAELIFFKGPCWKSRTIFPTLLLMSYWPELSHMALSSFEEDLKM